MNWNETQELIEEIRRDCPHCTPVQYCWKGENCVIHIGKSDIVTPLLVTSREDYERLKRDGAI
jgi:hypothetical protein